MSIIQKRNSAGNLLTNPLYFAAGDSASTDAFGRWRIAAPTTLFDSQFEYDDQPLLWEETNAGSGTGTHDSADSTFNMAVTTASGDKVVKQTRQYFRYQPGKSQFIAMTFVLATAIANMRQRVGYFDASNGVYLETSGTTVNLCILNSGTTADQTVARSSWDDPMDGTGASGKNVDFTKAQILIIDLQWLSVGRVRVGFDIEGVLYYAHSFNHANVSTDPYMKTANLPVRYEIENTGTAAGGSTLKAICSTVISEGGLEERAAFPFAADTGATTTGISVGTTLIPLISIRPKATFNSIVNRGTILPAHFECVTKDQPIILRVIYNGSLTNESFTSAGTNSITEYDISATAISGGQQIATAYVSAASAGGGGGGGSRSAGSAMQSLSSRLPLTLDIAGSNPIPLTIAAAVLNSTSSETWASWEWNELR